MFFSRSIKFIIQIEIKKICSCYFAIVIYEDMYLLYMLCVSVLEMFAAKVRANKCVYHIYTATIHRIIDILAQHRACMLSG